MAGFRTFATGEVLTAANVNDFLMGQSVMRFADADARTAALGAEVTEGMLTFNKDTGQLEVFDGADFVEAGGAGGGLDSIEVITATNTGFVIPALANPIVRVTVIGAGGGGGGSGSNGGGGGSTTFDAGAAGTIVAEGGHAGGGGNAVFRGHEQTIRIPSGGNGGAGSSNGNNNGKNGGGGRVIVQYMDLSAISNVSVTIGAGGGGGSSVANNTGGGTGGAGLVILEFKADQ